MKQIWITRKGRDGVSPVIATILMVAITVVLAAVLYVMVIGIDGGGGPPGAGNWNDMEALSKTSGRVEFGSFTGTMLPIDAKLFI